MKKVGRHLYANFQLEGVNEVSSCTKSVILIGDSGTGKSRLVNNLCGPLQKDQAISFGGVTQQAFQGICSRLSPGKILKITDTPAIQRDNSEKLAKLNYTMKSSRWNMVLINAKLDSRFEKTFAELKMNQRLIDPKKSSKLLYLISFGDLIDSHEQEQVMKGIDQMALKAGLGKEKILIYSNCFSDMDRLAGILYHISETHQESFQLTVKQNRQSSQQTQNRQPVQQPPVQARTCGDKIEQTLCRLCPFFKKRIVR